MNTIAITDIPGFRIGQVEDAEAATGVTAILFPEGAPAGLDVRGGGPASRDSRILDPLAAAEFVHAVVLAGGSAFGLDAAGGVQRYLEERGVGLPVGDVRVPLVCQSDIFDLLVGESDVRPDAAMGYAACVASEQGERGNYRDGNHGVGCGATVGKACGGEFCMKAGVGSYAMQLAALQVGALVVVNAMGDVRDPETGQTVAGVLAQDRRGFRSTSKVLYDAYEAQAAHGADGGQAGEHGGGRDGEHAEGHGGERAGERVGDARAASAPVTNTTIGAIITNAALSKAQLCKLAGMSHDGYARAISPVHTSMDGDSIYALSVGDVSAPLDVVGTLAADVMAQAILVAARSAEPAYGMPSAKSFDGE